MNLLLHTIALEPARWLPQRVSRPLPELLGQIARTPFRLLEIFEPHLARADDEMQLVDALAKEGLVPVILSSYLNSAPANTAFAEEAAALIARVHRFAFKKVRLFPGPGVAAQDRAACQLVAQRIRELARTLPETEFLLETHDGSIADDPTAVVRLVEEIDCPNVGLLWQPTIFQRDRALSQLAAQRHLVRHVHLQNRWPDGAFAPLHEGVIPWAEILPQLNVHRSLEFVPSGVVEVADFDLQRCLLEAVAEAEYISSLSC